MHKQVSKQTGFTIVELLIVIVVIAILAAITIVAYNGIQNRATAAKEISDIQSIDKAIQLYYIDNGSYPPTPGNTWVGWSQAPNFVPGITPKYIANQPQRNSSADSSATYLYESNGTDYKLLSHRPQPPNNYPVCAAASSAVPAMADTARSCWAFGTWSSAAAGW